MARIDEVAERIAAVCQTIIAVNPPIPGEVVTGWPIESSISAIIKNNGWMVSVYPRQDSKPINFGIKQQVIVPTFVPTLLCSVENNVATFTGDPTVSVMNVHVQIDNDPVVIVQTAATESLPSFITRLSGVINTEIVGVDAFAVSNILTVMNCLKLQVRIGGSVIGKVRTRRVGRGLQITVWAGNPILRSQISNLLENGLGTEEGSFILMPDNTKVWLKYKSDALIDMTEADQNAYQDHRLFYCEYSVYDEEPYTQVETFYPITTHSVP